MSEAPLFTHNPCCSSHGIPMDCERYRRTHFVEVRPCCSFDAERLLGPDSQHQIVVEVMQRADPEVWAKIAGELLAAALTRSVGGLSVDQMVAKYKKDHGIRS